MRSGILNNLRTAQQIQIKEALIQPVFDKWTYHFLEKCWVMLKQKEVELVTKIFIIGLQFLLLRVGEPLRYPFR